MKTDNKMKIQSKKAQLKIQAMTNQRFFKLGFSKKGQLKIQEMVFMLIGVFIFFILVGIFVFILVYSNLSDAATKIAEERTLSAVTSLSDTPEFSCFDKSNCVDGDKIINLVGKDVYQGLWPYSSLKFIKYSGFEKDEKDLIECNFANYPNCDLFLIYDKEVEDERSVISHVVICRKISLTGYIYDKCEIAKIIAGTQLRK